MERQRFSVTDLMEAIRNEGYASLSEVNYVLMETNGNISVIPSSETETKLSYVIVDSGNIYEGNLKRLGLNKEWLFKELKKANINSVKEVFYFSADSSKNTFLMKQEKNK